MYIASTMNPMNDNESDSLYDDGCDIHKLTNACMRLYTATTLPK